MYAGLLTLENEPELQNTRVILHCDNISVVYMVNNMTAGCQYCMELLRILALNNLIHNRRVFVQHVRRIHNNLSDALSRLQFNRFFKLALKTVNQFPDMVPCSSWPLTHWWNMVESGNSCITYPQQQLCDVTFSIHRQKGGKVKNQVTKFRHFDYLNYSN